MATTSKPGSPRASPKTVSGILKTLDSADQKRGAPLAEIRQKFASRSNRAISSEGGEGAREFEPLPAGGNKVDSVVRESSKLIEKLIFHKHEDITPADIDNASNETLILYLPLITGTIQNIGADGNLRDTFLLLLQSFLNRLNKSRSLKLYFILLAGNPEYSAYWKLSLIHVSTNLQTQRIKTGDPSATLIAPVTEQRSLKLFESFVFSEKSYEDISKKASNLTASTSAASGGEVKTNNPVYHSADAISNSSRTLDSSGPHAKAPKKSKFRRSKNKNKIVDVAATEQQRIDKRKTVIYDNKSRGVGAIKVTLPVDIIEIQSIRFWTKTVQSVSPETVKSKAAEDEKFEWNTAVIHPMAYLKKAQKTAKDTYDARANDGRLQEELEMGNPILARVTVEKVFTSVAAPMLLGTFYLPEDCKLEDDTELAPRIIAKKGDNLFQDLAVETMSLCFNEIWRKEYEAEGSLVLKKEVFRVSVDEIMKDHKDEKKRRGIFSKRDKTKTDEKDDKSDNEEEDVDGGDDCPFSYTYQVIPTGNQEGILEVCNPVIAFKSFDWDEWFSNRTSASMKRLMNSAAGGFIGCFVLGVRDRHWDNILVLGGDTVLNIDFGYLLGRRPPIDAPEFAVSKKMRDNLRMAKMWTPFLNKCVLAFRWLRKNSGAVIKTCRIVFAQMGISPDHVEAFLRSKQSLALDLSDAEAEESIRNLIEASPNSWQNLFKQVSHCSIDPVYYGLLKMHFPVAVFAQNLVRKSDAKKAEERKFQNASRGKDDMMVVVPKGLDARRRMSKQESKDDLGLFNKSKHI